VPLRARWQVAASLVARTRDVLDARPGDPRHSDDEGVPASLAARGWAAFLLSLGDERVEAFEAHGRDADWRDAPPSLAALALEIRDVCALPSLVDADPVAPVAPARAARPLETPRKRAQIDAFARVIVPLASGATRVVDVGSGHGHLTRAIAERIARPVVGLERDGALARRARALFSDGDAVFAVTDVLRDGLRLLPGDCAIGLHACGELGDAMVESASAVEGPAAVALVGCCLQKRRAASRRPLVANHAFGDALELPRPMLGLSNLTARDDGVEATRADNLAGRQRRLALHRLLSARVGSLRLGAEIDGLNRRASHGELASLVARAFEHRGLDAPSPSDIEQAAVWAGAAHARSRRLSLPRSMLARVLEVFVALDRAVYLEERGFTAAVGTVFSPEVSARNLAVLGWRPPWGSSTD
jgi:SAM-dependent methyltransferase